MVVSFVGLLGAIVQVSKDGMFVFALLFLLSVIVRGLASIIEAVNENTNDLRKRMGD